MRVGAYSHTDSAIRSDGIPVAETSIRINPPPPCAIGFFPIVKGDGAAGAILGTLLTKGTKVDHGAAVHSFIWN
jgi:hypothetical protein